MKRSYALLLILSFFADSCGLHKRNSSSRLADDEMWDGTTNHADIENRIPAHTGDIPLADYHGPQDVPQKEITFGELPIAASSPEPNRPATRESYDHQGSGAQIGKLPSPVPQMKEVPLSMDASGGIEAVKSRNQALIQNLDKRLSEAAAKQQASAAHYKAMTEAAMTAHNDSAREIVRSNGLTQPHPQWEYQTPRDTIAGQKLEHAKAYRDYVAQEVAKDTTAHREPRQQLVDFADATLAVADDQYYNQSESSGDFYRNLAYQGLSLALSGIPVVGEAVDLVQAVTGRGLLGEQLTDFDRGILFAGVLLPVVTPGMLKAVVRVYEKVGTSKYFGVLVARTLGKSEKVVEVAEKLGTRSDELAGLTKEAETLAGKSAEGLYEAAAKNKPLGLGSTGRTIPKNLQEQAAMLVTKADPQKGTKLPIDLKDARWHENHGWEKWQTIFETSDGQIKIHYNRNKMTGAVDDFKFDDGAIR